MTHYQFPVGEDDLQALIDGRLEHQRQLEVEAWLRANPEAAEVIERDRQLSQQLKEAAISGEGPIPASLRVGEISQQLRSERRKRMSSLAASFAILAAGTTAGWVGKSAVSSDGGGHMQDAVYAYQTFVSHGPKLDVTAANPVLLEELIRTTGSNSKLPALELGEFSAAGGRLMATEDGPAFLIVYRNQQGQYLTYYVRPTTGQKPSTPQSRRDGPIETRYWYADGLGYALTGPVGSAAIDNAATRLISQTQS